MQKQLAIRSMEKLQESFNRKIVTEIEQFTSFYEAEEYHQDYYVKNPLHYKLYRTGCSRDRRLKEVWGDDISH